MGNERTCANCGCVFTPGHLAGFASESFCPSCLPGPAEAAYAAYKDTKDRLEEAGYHDVAHERACGAAGRTVEKIAQRGKYGGSREVIRCNMCQCIVDGPLAICDECKRNNEHRDQERAEELERQQREIDDISNRY